MKYIVFLITLCILLIPAPAAGLGRLAHQAVCEIAYQHLNDNATAEVNRLLSFEKNERYNEFSNACAWADDKRGGRTDKRRNDHFVNFPRDLLKISNNQCLLNKRCIFSAIDEDLNTLANSKNNQEKLKALKYLAHWIGDIHQPFHVSFQDDRGGNNIYLTSDSLCEKNLHAVWDRCLLEFYVKKNHLNTRIRKDRELFFEILIASISDEQAAAWTKNTSIVEWANESFDIVRAPEVIYCFNKDKACWYSNRDRYHIHRGKNKNSRKIVISKEYLNQFDDLLILQIQKAGIRLSHLLNQTLGK